MESIYCLHVKGSPEKPFYVGRSDACTRRLAEHIRSASPTGTKKERHIYALLQAGHEIDFTILACGSARQMEGKEDLFITNLEGAGHELMNGRAGDSALVEYECGEAVPWTPDLFTSANWQPGHHGAKKSEVSAWIKHVLFHRQGRKLRFHHHSYGIWDVATGGDIHSKYAKACRMLTLGTVENTCLRQQVEQVRRLKG